MSHNTEDAGRSGKVLPAINCEGKVRFDSHAMAAGVSARTRRGRHGGRSAYKCGHCRGFHLGTDGGMVTKKKRLALGRMKAVEA